MEVTASNKTLRAVGRADLSGDQKKSLQIIIRDPGSAITHLIGTILTVLGSIPLLIKAVLTGGSDRFIAMVIFMASMTALYAASTTYHTVNLSGNALKVFKRLDHMMIFVLIAGSYTPTCMLVLEKPLGHRLLATVWIIALIGMIFKLFWVTCPKWLSSTLYIAMGWVVVFAMRSLWQALSLPAFLWLLAGGLIYTAGGVIYALKLPIFNSRHKNFGSHEIFHLFVMGGSLCHYIFTYCFLA